MMRVTFGRRIGYIARLDSVNPKPLVKSESGVYLPLVIHGSARGLVVRNEAHALLLRVCREPGEVVIRIGLRERECICVLDPVPVTSDVPPFDEISAVDIGCREID